MRSRSVRLHRRWTLAVSVVATLSAGCSALFSADLADNGTAAPGGGAAGAAGQGGGAIAGRAGNAGFSGKAGGAGSTGGGGGGGAKPGGAGGSSGASGSGGNAGNAGSSGQGGAPVAGGGGTSGSAGQTQAGQGGTTQPVGGQAGTSGGSTAGSGGGGASAGTGGTTAGSAGAATGGTAGVGASGGQSGKAGAAGASGSSGAAGTNGCPQLPVGQPPQPPTCGNGVVELGEECDVGPSSANDGCSPTCLLTCTGGVLVGRTCYAVSDDTFRGEQIFDVPNGPGVTQANQFLAEMVSDQACDPLPGPTAHVAILNRTGERAALLASAAFQAHLSSGVTGSKNGSAWIAMGYRWLSSSAVTDPTRWFWNEGGGVDPSQWAPGYPKVDGSGPGGPGSRPDGCGSLNGSLALENHDCENSLRRPVLCEREPACAMRAGGGGPWQVGYQGENGHCYLRLQQQTSYENAANACKDLGAHLAAFETIEELRALPGIMAGFGDAWVGARRESCAKGPDDGSFVWATNGAVVPTGPADPGYWASGEPNDLLNQEGCAQMTRTHGLNDTRCNDAFRAICERDY